MVVRGLAAAGMEVVVARLCRGLSRRGHVVGVTCIEYCGDLGESLQRDGIRVSLVATPGIRTILWPRILTAWFRRIRPHVVHVHSGAWLKAARGAARAEVPRVVHTIHGLLDHETWTSIQIKRWAAHYTHVIAAVSR